MLNRADLILLSLLTLFWGVNWPIMKFAVTNFPPLAFRSLSMIIALVVVFVYIRLSGEKLYVPKIDRQRVVSLTIGNMLIWHLCSIYAIKLLSSGRAAIIGYTMPVWALLASVIFFRGKLTWRGGLGVLFAMSATFLLAAEEFTAFLGQPIGLGIMMAAAISWGIGTAMMNHYKISISNAALTFWMMVITSCFLFVGTILFERHHWRMPTNGEWAAIGFNGIVVFAFCHIVWFRIARKLPPVASSLSIMLIPVLGVFSGSWMLGEVIGAGDITALVLILLSMAAVLLPKKKSSKALPPES